jgi:predicted deacylase
MKKLLLIYSLLFASMFAMSGTPAKSNNTHTCSAGSVRLTADFVSGRMDDCTRVTEQEYLITLVPENTPINSSPWYAFKIEADQPTDISIIVKVRGDKNRYPPKVSLDGKKWQLQAHTLKDDRLIINLTASTQPVFIAAQEIINNQYYVDWAKKLTADNQATHSVLGNSTQGRPIYKLEHRNENAKEWLVILGRQHPPEITGALALFPFVETLLANSEMSEAYLSKYNLLVIPNINPDGVHAGNWRHNTNGIDLNRDWGNFSQAETQLINNYLDNLVSQGQKITFAVDFHSTRRDIFYTMPTDYGMEQPYFVEHWLAMLNDETPDFDVVMRPGSNPNNGVSKQYFADKFNVHAVTYEMGDNTERSKIVSIANKAASTLMKTMLSDIDHNINHTKSHTTDGMTEQ